MAGSVTELSKYRFECALEALEDARLMFSHGRYKNTLNRAYYSIFHALRAVNALDGFDSSKHSGVIAYFNLHYVKTGIFPKETSKIIRLASEQREYADYLDFFIASKDAAEEQIQRAQQLNDRVQDYLIQKGILSDSQTT
jgi:uncharacterized protein (UPF0332 family)